MKYKPVYNYQRDLTYRKRIGRSSDPKRFGLTPVQVQELKTAGQWDKFLEGWYAQRSRFWYRNRLYCIVCGGIKHNVIIILGQRICRECCDEIRKRVKEN
jgi:hypothetical protein